MKYYIELSQEDYEFLSDYNSLPEQSKKMVYIVCKIGASHLLTSGRISSADSKSDAPRNITCLFQAWDFTSPQLKKAWLNLPLYFLLLFLSAAAFLLFLAQKLLYILFGL